MKAPAIGVIAPLEPMTKTADVPGVTASRTHFTKSSSTPKSAMLPAIAPAAAPNRGPASGVRKISASTTPQKPPHNAPGCVTPPRSRTDGLRWPGGHDTSAAASTSAVPSRIRRASAGSRSSATPGALKRHTASVAVGRDLDVSHRSAPPRGRGTPRLTAAPR